MTRAPSLYPKYVGLANTIAQDWHLPGFDRDDVHQEARIGLWIACRDYDPSKGVPFRSWAGLVIRRRLADKFRSAKRPCHAVLTLADRDDLAMRRMVARTTVEQTVIDREQLRWAVDNPNELTPEARARRYSREWRKRRAA